MIYFDTDVLVNYQVLQAAAKQQQATQLYERATQDGLFLISVISLNELAYVLSKLKLTREEVKRKVEIFYPSNPVGVTLAHFQRAAELAEWIGFQNTTDCLHTALAETHCTELYTYNRADFSRI